MSTRFCEQCLQEYTPSDPMAPGGGDCPHCRGAGYTSAPPLAAPPRPREDDLFSELPPGGIPQQPHQWQPPPPQYYSSNAPVGPQTQHDEQVLAAYLQRGHQSIQDDPPEPKSFLLSTFVQFGGIAAIFFLWGVLSLASWLMPEFSLLLVFVGFVAMCFGGIQVHLLAVDEGMEFLAMDLGYHPALRMWMLTAKMIAVPIIMVYLLIINFGEAWKPTVTTIAGLAMLGTGLGFMVRG